MGKAEERPVNPIKDILIFEKEIKKRYEQETRRRFVYFMVMLIIQCGYILYVSTKVYNILGDIKSTEIILLGGLIYRVYMQMLFSIFLTSYVFIRLLRNSSKITKTLTSQLKLLNIFFKNRKITLCPVKTPNNIKIAINIFREEEERKKSTHRKA